MERKIGEIFEFGGEWYQCVESDSCGECSLFTTECGSGTKSDLADKVFGQCSKVRRTDNKHVIFKKLEKVGEPYIIGNKLIQRYKMYPTTYHINVYGWYYHNLDVKSWTIDIEIKQNKEDMEENKLNLKPFDIQKAREGKPVCTRDGRKAIFLTTLSNKNFPVVAIVCCGQEENIYQYDINGVCDEHDNNLDLMMLPEKKEGWVNVYRDCDGANITKDDNIYSSKDAAIASAQIIDRENYVATTIIKWEE